MERRRFNDRERAALYLAADGRCESCGVELEPGWHGDHKMPYSRGGPTDVINGQALCPDCNLKKGVSVNGLRKWQQQAISKFYESEGRDFLICATPGAGKTTCGLELARQLLTGGSVNRIAEMWQAREYAETLARITGEQPTVVLSDEPQSKENIDAFRAGRARWLVAVKMVSEGVDIPRLAVGVFASRTRTPLFFRQVAGRFVRVRPGEEFNARLFIPALPTLMDHAREIEDELRHQIDVEFEREARERTEREGQQEQLSFRESIGATEPTFAEAIYKGDGISPEDLAAAQERCRQFGIPAIYASGVAKLIRDGGPVVPVPQEPKEEVPRHRVEKMLRGDLDKLAGKVAYRIGGGSRIGAAKKEVHTELLKRGFPSRGKAGLDDLEKMRDFLVRWLDDLS